ncbi:hypothetical protein CYLTODRAFT_447492 [Cylindrobasidium torrendii FP15055 ss-10]|uniref:Uncharacterized protein n=1 Tax=Cylindrobasidium torrendii FP15055 ss-10 TaxID=1314674 RepID=A0A0D7AV36_9AGAR|nr:hypothetical protein CYLTODRAFT_447492 [Cylindrobasidium torrendii FP15055 ss-10]
MPTRRLCTVPGCLCQSYIQSDPLRCWCGHTSGEHPIEDTAPPHVNPPAKGGYLVDGVVICAGFFSAGNYTPTTLCGRPHCGHLWLEHENLDADVTPTLSAPLPSSATPSNSLPPATSWCAPQNISELRRTEAARHRGQSAIPSSAFGTSFIETTQSQGQLVASHPRNISVVRDGTITSQQAAFGRNGRRGSNYDNVLARMFAGNSASTPTQSSHNASASGSSLQSIRSVTTSGPRTLPSGMLAQDFVVLIIPYQVGLTPSLPTEMPLSRAMELRIYPAAAPQLISLFDNAKLSVQVTLQVHTLEDSVESQLYEAVAGHLNAHHIAPSTGQFDSTMPQYSPFVPLRLGKVQPSHGTKLLPDTLFPGQLTLNALSTTTSHRRNLKLVKDRQQIVFVALRTSRLNGALTFEPGGSYSSVDVHPCFSARFLERANRLAPPNMYAASSTDSFCDENCPPLVPQDSAGASDFFTNPHPNSLNTPLQVRDFLDDPHTDGDPLFLMTPTPRLSTPPLLQDPINLLPSSTQRRHDRNEGDRSDLPIDLRSPPRQRQRREQPEITEGETSSTLTPIEFLRRRYAFNRTPSPIAPAANPASSASTTATLHQPTSSIPTPAVTLPLPLARPPPPPPQADEEHISDPTVFYEIVREQNSEQLHTVGLSLQAESLESGAEVLKAITRVYHASGGVDRMVRDIPGVRTFHSKNLLLGDRFWTIGAGIGSGVERHILHTACTSYSSDRQYFRTIPDDKHVAWTFSLSSNQTRIEAARSVGSLMALHLFWLGVTATPIHPLLYVLVLRDLDYASHPRVLSMLVPHLADDLANWPRTLATKDSMRAHFCCNPPSILDMLIATHLHNVTSSQARDCNDEEEWRTFTRDVFASALYQTSSLVLDTSTHLAALREGFDHVLGDSGFNLIATFQGADVASLIFNASGQKISSVDELISHLEWPHNSEFTDAFRTRLEHYLTLPGHPESTHSLVSPEAVAKDLRPLFRVDRLLLTCTGSELKPPEDAWHIEVLAVQRPLTDHAVIEFKSCARKLLVTQKPEIEQWMVNVPDLQPGEEDAEFASWFHPYLLDFQNASDYNVL